VLKYILITPARNEEGNLGRLINAVERQSQLPERWVIVNDGSRDDTGRIAEEAAHRHGWIDVVHMPQDRDRSFAGKVRAFNAGLARMTRVEFDIIGNVDADTAFDANYMEFLMGQFASNTRLGVGGTPFVQDDGYDSAVNSFEGDGYVSGGCQLFRRRCFEEIGGYVPNRAGGLDWIAVTKALMAQWVVRCFAEMRYRHYRPLGTAGKSAFRASCDYGERAYYLGWSPI